MATINTTAENLSLGQIKWMCKSAGLTFTSATRAHGVWTVVLEDGDGDRYVGHGEHLIDAVIEVCTDVGKLGLIQLNPL